MLPQLGNPLSSECLPSKSPAVARIPLPSMLCVLPSCSFSDEVHEMCPSIVSSDLPFLPPDAVQNYSRNLSYYHVYLPSVTATEHDDKTCSTFAGYLLNNVAGIHWSSFLLLRRPAVATDVWEIRHTCRSRRLYVPAMFSPKHLPYVLCFAMWPSIYL